MNMKAIIKHWITIGLLIGFTVSILFAGFIFFLVHFNTTGSLPMPNPEHPMLYSPINVIICDTPILIKALGLEINESYAIQYSKTDSFVHNWTALGEEYNIVLKFEYKHKLGDYVFLYLYTNDKIIDTLFFQVEEVEG